MATRQRACQVSSGCLDNTAHLCTFFPYWMWLASTDRATVHAWYSLFIWHKRNISVYFWKTLARSTPCIRTRPCACSGTTVQGECAGPASTSRCSTSAFYCCARLGISWQAARYSAPLSRGQARRTHVPLNEQRQRVSQTSAETRSPAAYPYPSLIPSRIEDDEELISIAPWHDIVNGERVWMHASRSQALRR